MSRAIFSLPLFNKHFLSLSRRISSFHRHSRRFLFKEDRTILLILELNSKIRNALSIDGGNYKCKPLAAITVAFRLGFGIITRSPRTTDQANDRGNRKKKKGGRGEGGREGGINTRWLLCDLIYASPFHHSLDLLLRINKTLSLIATLR